MCGCFRSYPPRCGRAWRGRYTGEGGRWRQGWAWGGVGGMVSDCVYMAMAKRRRERAKEAESQRSREEGERDSERQRERAQKKGDGQNGQTGTSRLSMAQADPNGHCCVNSVRP